MRSINRGGRRVLRIIGAVLIFSGVVAPIRPAVAAGGDHTVSGAGCTGGTWWGRVPIPLIYAELVPQFDHSCLKIEASTAGGGTGRAQLFGVNTPYTDGWWLPDPPSSSGSIKLVDLDLDCVAVEESPTRHMIFASGTDSNGERGFVTVTTNGFVVYENWEQPFTPCGAHDFTVPVYTGGYTIDHIDPSPNSFPTAAFEATCVGLTCTFDGSTSTDTDGEVVRYRWGVEPKWIRDDPSSNHGGESVTITLTRADLLDVKLLVTDDDGATNVVTKEVNVGLPVSKQAAPVCKGLTCTFDASPSTDPDGTVVHHYWNLYDDNRRADGTSPKLTHTYSRAGRFSVGVRVVDNDGNTSPWMDWVTVEVSDAPSAPAAPSSLAAKAESTSTIRLDWTDVSGESGYKVQRSLDGASWTQIAMAPAGSTTFIDGGLAPSTVYHYRVIATNDTGDSAPSPVATAKTLADTTAPTAPTNLVAKSGRGRISLTWEAASDSGGSGLAGYIIYRSSGGSGAAFTRIASDITATSYDDNPVKKGTTYSYYVIAVDRAGNNSAPSNVATVRAT